MYATATSPDDRSVFLPSTFLVTAIVALGKALQEGNGALWADAISWLTVGLLSLFAAAVVTAPGRLDRYAAPAALGAALLALGLQFAWLLTARPGIYLRLSKTVALEDFTALVGVAAVLAGAACVGRAWVRWAAMAALLAVHLALGVWMLRASPAPHIDVFYFQKQSIEALLHGQNPYALTFRDIYGPASSAVFYGEGLSVNGRLQFGFPYPPLSLLLAIPGQLIAGDYRYSQLGAMTASAALLAFAFPRQRWGAIAACLFLFTPRSFFILEQGWTEPLVALLLVITSVVAVKVPRFLWLPLGLFLASKQYLVFAIPLALLLLSWPLKWREVWTQVWKTVAVALVVSLPLILWNLRAFIHDVVTLQIHQPFRADSLSYLAWMKARGMAPWPTVVAFLMALALVVLGMWRLRRRPGAFALSVALVFAGFFAFNKQAFANYYYLVIAAMCCALAFAVAEEPVSPLPTPSSEPPPAA